MKIQFFGAAGGVTGSCNLLKGDTSAVLVDLGLFQGLDDKNGINFKPLAFDISSLSAVMITHAHLDHCGRLPLLVQNGYKGKIYATKATKDIVAVSLLDASGIAHENGRHLYSEADVEDLVNLIETVDYDSPFTAGEFSITFRDAGHIIGSASIEFKKDNQTVVFSGDLGNTPEDLIKPTEYVKQADFVVMESTYGYTQHPGGDPEQILQDEINKVEESGGTLLIPAFSIERTQEVLHIINHLKGKNLVKKQTPVFLDSPLASKVVDIFKKYPDLYNEKTRNETNPFDFSNLHTIENMSQSKSIIDEKGVKVIIAGSGMMTGGRILQHLKNYISNPLTRILIVGYQGEGTLGREIEDGAKQVMIDNMPFSVKAAVSKTDSLSSHADYPKLISWLKHISGIKKVFINHGEEQSRKDLAEKIKSQFGLEAILPEANEEFEL